MMSQDSWNYTFVCNQVLTTFVKHFLGVARGIGYVADKMILAFEMYVAGYCKHYISY
jgi:hypothetical protein